MFSACFGNIKIYMPAYIVDSRDVYVCLWYIYIWIGISTRQCVIVSLCVWVCMCVHVWVCVFFVCVCRFHIYIWHLSGITYIFIIIRPSYFCISNVT